MSYRRARLVVIVGLCAAIATALAATPALTAPRARKVPVIPFTRNGTVRLREATAIAIFSRYDKVSDWLGRYEQSKLTKSAEFDNAGRYWTVKVWDARKNGAGEIAEGRVDDASSLVTQARTGPQVAWGMARGSPGAFGGKEINSLPVWLGFCLVFLIGLADFRRLRSIRNLDLVVLLSFSVSLWYFNQGRIFSSVPLVYPPLFYLAARLLYIGISGRLAPRGRPLWPVWVLAGATVFLTGFRIGLNVRTSNVIDVGYAGVIGANRIVSGQSPYGHFPSETIKGVDLKACSAKDSEGHVRDRRP